MRAVLLTRHGGPDALEYREDVPEPTPAPGEVRLRVRAAALNNTDVWTRVADVVELASRGALRPVVAGRYPLAGMRQAQADFVAKDFVGKLVVEP